MTLQEAILRIFSAVFPLAPAIVVVLGLTLALLIFMQICAHKLWIDRWQMRVLSIFFELDFKGCLRLACSWMKILVLFTYIIYFDKLQPMNYIILIVPSLIYVFTGTIKKLPSRFLWIVLEIIGMFSLNLVCGFILDIDPGVEYIILYILLSIFLALFVIYLFVLEMDEISSERRINIEKYKEDNDLQKRLKKEFELKD